RSFPPGVRLAGVILNRVGSPRHAEILRDALEEVGTPVLGSLHRSATVAVPARHLGLVPVAEREPAALETVAALAALIAGAVDLSTVEAVTRSAPPLAAEPWTPPTAEPLAAAGAAVSTVDPLRDEALPAGCRGLVVGGGFPEVYAGELAENVPLKAAVAALAGSGAPMAAECAGLLWLCRSLDGAPMCGVIDATAEMTEALTLGYRDAVAVSPSWLAPVGTRVTGHEFHRTT